MNLGFNKTNNDVWNTLLASFAKLGGLFYIPNLVIEHTLRRSRTFCDHSSQGNRVFRYARLAFFDSQPVSWYAFLRARGDAEASFPFCLNLKSDVHQTLAAQTGAGRVFAFMTPPPQPPA